MLEKPPIDSADFIKAVRSQDPSFLETMCMAARVWAATHPDATIEERQYLAAMVAKELAGR